MMPLAEPSARILTQLGVPAADGTELATDVYLPERAVAAPAVLIRTPYGRTGPLLMRLALRLAAEGWCAVLQDCRGRYGSGGSFDLLSEAGDSRAALRWLGDQPWCDGQVGLVGISISGLPNLMVAAEPPGDGARVRALVNVMGAVDYHGMCYHGGALVLHWALPWITMMGSINMGRTGWQQLDWHRVFRHLPLAEAIVETGGNAEFWRLVVEYPDYGGFWRQLTATPGLGRVQVPVLHLAGRRDFMLDQTLLAYDALTASPEAGEQRLIIGPWDHRTVFATAGAEQRGGVLDQLVGWFGRWLETETGELRTAAARSVSVHVENAGWLEADAFPPPSVEPRQRWLLSGGRANGAAGDGALVAEPPAALGHDAFDYDPDRPVPTVGGAVWPFPAAGLLPGDADQAEVEAREDVLVYTGEPLAEELTVVGPVELILWAATSGRDTDFTGKLVDVDPAGAARVVQDGVVRGRFREGRDRQQLLEPQTPYRFAISLGVVAHRFRAGHRLRLEVASSNFPKFDRNLNSAEPPHLATRSMVARQTVFHGGRMASRLRLPVVSRAAWETLRVAPAGGAAGDLDG